MSGVRQRPPKTSGKDSKKTSQNNGGGLLSQEDDGLEVKYVVIILVIVFVFSFIAALYCLGLLGDYNILLNGRDSRSPLPKQFFPGMNKQPVSQEQTDHGDVPPEWVEEEGMPQDTFPKGTGQGDIPEQRHVPQDGMKQADVSQELPEQVQSHVPLKETGHEDVSQEIPAQRHVPQEGAEQVDISQEVPGQGHVSQEAGGHGGVPLQEQKQGGIPQEQGQNIPPGNWDDDMVPPPRRVVPTGPPQEQIARPKSDRIAPRSTSDHEPPVRQKLYTPPAPKDTQLDKPTILWWTDALYPHRDRGAKAELKCGKSTCISTVHKNLLGDPMTRGIMFYGTDVRSYEMPLPRKPWHEWALLHEESPQNNYLLSHAPMMRLFNHTATFHRSSHYPLTTQNVPSLEYLVERKPVPLEIKNEYRKKGVAPIVYVQSHCDVPSDRDRFVKKLMEYIPVDSYGRCVHNKDLPPDLRDPVETMGDERFYNLLSNYKFNLAFENAVCEDYITEKLYRPLYVGSVPISRGSMGVRDWAPDDNSIILAEDFDGPEMLAKHIKFLDENDDEYLKYLKFKDTGVTNENLIRTIVNRPFGVTREGHVSFITDYECYVCEKLVERLEAEEAHKEDPSKPLLPPSIGEYSHMPCAEPFASIYPLDEAGDLGE